MKRYRYSDARKSKKEPPKNPSRLRPATLLSGQASQLLSPAAGPSMMSTPVSPEPLSTILLDKGRRQHDVNLLTLLSPKMKRQKTTEHNTAPEAVKLAVCLLEDEFKLREAASEAFPPKIASSHIRTSVSKYEDEMSAASLRSVCCSCGRFVAAPDIYKIDGQADFILPPQRTLDRCGYHESSWDFCTTCHSAVSRGNIPKFSALNLVNVTTCQHYPSVLEDLTVIEECLIAKCHPVGTILKLRPGGRPSPSNYNALRGHMIVIPQNPGPLLQILPSPELRVDNLIKVFWLGKRAPADADLKPFLQVRKDKVLAALQYLVQHNHLYHNLTINHAMVDSWNEEFIPPEIRDNIICLGSSDHHEREGYTVSLQTGNCENDLHAAQDEVLDLDDQEALITGSVYTDINGERQDPNTRMIHTLRGVLARNQCKTDDSSPATDDTADECRPRHGDIPSISYAVRGQFALMNNWEDPHYFTAAFPTLFPNGIGGHQDERTVPVSLTAFAEWALNHHSRREVVPVYCDESLTLIPLQIRTPQDLHVPSLRCIATPELISWKRTTCEASRLEVGRRRHSLFDS
jgi:hypothetical protein